MHFIIRFLILTVFTFGLLSAAPAGWRKHNRLLIALYFLVTGLLFLA